MRGARSAYLACLLRSSRGSGGLAVRPRPAPSAGPENIGCQRPAIIRAKSFRFGRPDAIGLGAALDWMQALDWHPIQMHELRLTRRLLDGLASIAGARVLGPADTPDRRGVVSFSIKGFSAEEVCRFLDRRCAARRLPLRPAARARVWCRWRGPRKPGPYSVDCDIDMLLRGLEELVGTRSAHPSRRGRVLAGKLRVL